MGREVGEIRVFDLGGRGADCGREFGGVGPAQVESVGGSGAGRSLRAGGQEKWGYEDPFQGLRGPFLGYPGATRTLSGLDLPELPALHKCAELPFGAHASLSRTAERPCGALFNPTLQAAASWHQLVAGTRGL